MGTANSNLEKQLDKMCSEKERFIGFKNPKNVCYANSVMQSLFYCKMFRKKVLNLKLANNEKDTSMLRGVYTFFNMIESQKKRVGSIDPMSYIALVKSNNEAFNNDHHHDAHEFLIWLLDNIHEFIKNENSKKSLTKKEESVYYLFITYTFISEIFEGKQSSITKCLNCENITQRTESYFHLSVDVEQNTSLTNCLKNYIVKELLKMKDKFYCSICNSLQEAEKQVLLETLPKILIIHLKRFKVTYNSHKKLNYAINLPSELRLDFLLKNKSDSKAYNLFAIVVHVGNGIDYGHYFCLIKTCGKWFKFDDENVDSKDINEFLGNPDEEYEYNSNFCAYMLLYEPAEENKETYS